MAPRDGVLDRYIGADAGTLRFRGRPENSVTSYNVDSGALGGNHANEASVEAQWGHGPVPVSGDFAHAWVDAPDSGNPQFRGAYIVAG